jgi:hypothetical protein
MKKVTYCTNSTIAEAWAVIVGKPGSVNDAEAGAIEFSAQQRLGPLRKEPAIVLVESANRDIVPPFWREQLSSREGRYLARFGHRYLSVHFLRRGEDKYETYARTLQPSVEGWLDTFSATLGTGKAQYPVERVSFGYDNAFEFPVADFDLSRYFKLNVGIGAESAGNGLSALEINFRASQGEKKLPVSVNLMVHGDPTVPQQVRVRTKVEAQVPVVNDCSFVEKAKLMVLLAEAKEAAKTVFFDIATDETHRIMGAQYARDAAAT